MKFTQKPVGERLPAALRKAAGVSDDTSIDDALDALEAKVAARRARDAAKLAAAIQIPAQPAALRSNGVRLLTREEAQDARLFGAATVHARKRVEATEEFFGKPLVDCLRDGDLGQ